MLLRRLVLAPCLRHQRFLSTASAPPPVTWRMWVERRKQGFIQVLLSGTAMLLAMHAVNVRNRGDELQAQLTEQLAMSAAARQRLLREAPALAKSMGLPADSESKFRSALAAVDAQYGKEAVAAAATPSPSAGSAPVPTPAAAVSASGAPPLKQQAVW